MSKCVVLQVADTRFAIKCSNSSFTNWLVDLYPDFLSREEPHLRLKLDLDNISQTRSSGQLLSIEAAGNHNRHVELRMRVACQNLADFFWPAFHVCLRCAIAAKQPPDLLLHSAGVVKGSTAYLFSGASGSGKSTVCELLTNQNGCTILHDDIIAISQKEGRFHAWSTPPKEEITDRRSIGAPLQAVFFLEQDQTNYAAKLGSREAARLLTQNFIAPMVVKDGSLGIAPTESLGILFSLAEHIPCYELHFRHEPDFWECIPPLAEMDTADENILRRHLIRGAGRTRCAISPDDLRTYL